MNDLQINRGHCSSGGGDSMSAKSQALELFRMGVPVRQIRELVGLDTNTITYILTRSGQRPKQVSVSPFMQRVCPFHDSCRDCKFTHCEFDKFRVVTV